MAELGTAPSFFVPGEGNMAGMTDKEYDALIARGNLTKDDLDRIRDYRPSHWGPPNPHSMRYGGDTWPDTTKDWHGSNS